jgi:DNA invertase Pin-like site-specific DNA recombinase
MVFVVDRNDRLARDLLVALTIRHEIEKLGCHIECADGTPPCNTPEGELFANILSAFAQFERKKIGQRTKAGLAHKRADGMYLGKCPVGYKRDTQGKLVPDEYEQNSVRYIMREHGAGLKAPEITARLQSIAGNIRGNPWCARTVHRIIERELAKLEF